MNFIINTERLQLIPFNAEDISLFLKLNNDAFIRKYLWDDELIGEELATTIIQQNDQHFTNDQFGLWKIQRKENDLVIGYVGLWYFFDEPQPQLIYALLEEFTGKGYATEASTSIIEYAFNQLGYDYLVAATDEPHLDSQHVALRLGMSFYEKRIEDGKKTLFYRIEKSSDN